MHHVFTNLGGIQEALLPLPVLTLWVHSKELKTSPELFCNSSLRQLPSWIQLNSKHQDKSICSHQIVSRPHLFTKLLNKLRISHIHFPFFQKKKNVCEINDLKTGKQNTGAPTPTSCTHLYPTKDN